MKRIIDFQQYSDGCAWRSRYSLCTHISGSPRCSWEICKLFKKKPKAQTWISVKERLPTKEEAKKKLLVCHLYPDGHCPTFFTNFDIEKQEWETLHGFITHWMDVIPPEVKKCRKE